MSRSASTSPGDGEAIEARAAAWLAQRDEGLTPEEAAEFARWQQADPRHAAAVARLDATWTTLQQLRTFRPQAQAHPDRDLLRRPRARIVRFPTTVIVGLIATAAALAVIAWVSRPFFKTPNRIEPASEYVTTADGYQRVTLSDGSILELNASSEVRVAFEAAVRRIALVRGEAHFTVAKNKSRPFIVEAKNIRVRAVGTAFNVRMADENIEVLVTEGKVSVRNDPALADDATGSSDRMLRAGERLAVTNGEAKAALPPAEAVSPAIVREMLSWQIPRLRFVETPLVEVIAQFNRRNQVQLELGDPALASLPVDGSFRPDNVEAFVRLLESSGAVRAERVSAERIVLRHE
jgi:transmembrane sensor